MNSNSILFISNAAFNVPIGAITIVGNALVLVSISRTPSLISPSNVLLLGLSFTDLSVGLIVQPLYVTMKFVQLTNGGQNLEFLTNLHGVCASYLCFVSFVNITLLSVDRFLALYLHLRYNELVTVKRIVLLLGAMWIFCAICVSTSAWLQKDTVTVIGALFAFISHFVNIVLYYNFYRIVRRHQLQIHIQAMVQSNTMVERITRLKRSFISMFYVYLLFMGCYLPFTVMSFFKTKLHLSAYEVSWTFIFANSSLNPFLFSWRIQGIRAAIKQTLEKAKQWLLCK